MTELLFLRSGFNARSTFQCHSHIISFAQKSSAKSDNIYLHAIEQLCLSNVRHISVDTSISSACVYVPMLLLFGRSSPTNWAHLVGTLARESAANWALLLHHSLTPIFIFRWHPHVRWKNCPKNNLKYSTFGPNQHRYIGSRSTTLCDRARDVNKILPLMAAVCCWPILGFDPSPK